MPRWTWRPWRRGGMARAPVVVPPHWMPARLTVPEMAAGDTWSSLPVGVTLVLGMTCTGRSLLLRHFAEMHAEANLLIGGDGRHPLATDGGLELAMVVAPGRTFLIDDAYAEAPPLGDDAAMRGWQTLAVEMRQRLVVVGHFGFLRGVCADRGGLPDWVDRVVVLGYGGTVKADLRPFGVPMATLPPMYEYVTWSPGNPADFALRRVPRRDPISSRTAGPSTP